MAKLTKQQARDALIAEHGARAEVADLMADAAERTGSAWGHAALPGVAVTGDRRRGYDIETGK